MVQGNLALKEDQPQPMISAAAAGKAMLDLQRSYEALRTTDQKRFAQDLDRRCQQVRLDTMSEMQHSAQRVHSEGRFAPTLLVNDPYRDTFVTLAEIRTNTLVLKLTFDAVDLTYDLEGWVKPSADWPFQPHRISRHFDDRREAEVKMTDIAARFFRVSGFRCLVDM